MDAMEAELVGVDLYEVLGLEAGADEKEVARAYKKRSLQHHPDRGGDVKKFLELKKARDHLLDPVKKKEYDRKLSQELMARKRQLERNAELAAKRKKMLDEHLQKEKGFELKRAEARDDLRRKNELAKLREKTAARQRELQDNLARQARRQNEVDTAASGTSTTQGGKSERTVTLKWDRRQFSHSDDSIIHALRQYGIIESIKMKSASAKVVFAHKQAAAQAVRVEGHSPVWREVIVQRHIIDDDVKDPCDTSQQQPNSTVLPLGPVSREDHALYEEVVLQKLRTWMENKTARADRAFT